LYTTLQKLPLSPWVITANLYVQPPLLLDEAAAVAAPVLLEAEVEPHALASSITPMTPAVNHVRLIAMTPSV
jgi:hypothetical protein